MIKTFSSKIAYLDKLKMHYITVHDDVLEAFIEDGEFLYNQRFYITLNDVITWQAGTVSLGNNAAYITLSKARMKTLDVHFGDEVEVRLKKDSSEFGFDVPEEFTEVLRQDPEGNERFRAMPKGKQRGIIYLVLQVKSSDKRIEKSLFFIENLKRAPKGKETMRHLLGKE